MEEQVYKTRIFKLPEEYPPQVGEVIGIRREATGFVGSEVLRLVEEQTHTATVGGVQGLYYYVVAKDVPVQEDE